MSKKLVAYFSASNVTRKVAERLAAACEADLYEIKPQAKYTKADLDWMDKKSRSTLEMQDRNCRPEIVMDDPNIEDYDTIFVGFPIWWYREPSIIDTFLEAYDFSDKKLIPFCTSGGSELGEATDNIRTLSKADVLQGRRFKASVSDEELKNWAVSFE
ncbi:MAG: NAD(P)H-dependent oxidoreductase [Erysipelotrichaceae bacterium]|nr:NAD(P)H-dependent oxidoreductase [Erysipelotrichaceae bacterium]